MRIALGKDTMAYYNRTDKNMAKTDCKHDSGKNFDTDLYSLDATFFISSFLLLKFSTINRRLSPKYSPQFECILINLTRWLFIFFILFSLISFPGPLINLFYKEMLALPLFFIPTRLLRRCSEILSEEMSHFSREIDV